MLTRNRFLLLVACPLIGLHDDARAQHVHGVVDVGIVVEGSDVGISLSAPLHDVAGFERAPSTEEQHARLEAAAEKLADGDALFGFPSAAACKVTSLGISGPSFLTGADARDDHDHDEAHDEHHEHDDEHEHDEDHDRERHDHDEHHHDEDHDHEEHDGDDHEGDAHADVVVQLNATCDDPDSLGAIEFRFTEFFYEVDEIRVQLLTEQGVRTYDLPGDTSAVSLIAR